MKYIIKIKSYDTDKTVKRIGPYSSERLAEKAQRGVDINLSDNFYSLIEITA